MKIGEIEFNFLTEKACMHGPFRHQHPSGSIPSISSAQVILDFRGSKGARLSDLVELRRYMDKCQKVERDRMKDIEASVLKTLNRLLIAQGEEISDDEESENEASEVADAVAEKVGRVKL